MAERKIQVPALHDAQKLIIHESKRFNVLYCGRRLGKTTLAINLAIAGKDDADTKCMVKGSPIGWFSPQYKILDEAYRECLRILHDVIVKKDDSKRRIEIIGGGSIEFWTLEDEDAGRSRKYARVIVDEAAVAQKLERCWNGAIRPTLVDLEGDAWFLSTTVKRRNAFSDLLHKRGDVKNVDFHRIGWKSWTIPTSANPYISKEELETLKSELSIDDYRREILAEIHDDSGNMFQRDWLRWYDTVVDWHKLPRAIIVDPAGSPAYSKNGLQKDTDYTAMIVVAFGEDKNVYVIDFIRERLTMSESTELLFELRREFECDVYYEKYGMQRDIEFIKIEQERQGYRFNIHELGGQMSKEDRIAKLEPMFRQGRVWFPSKALVKNNYASIHAEIKRWVEIELLAFPNVEHDDGLDCLARIFDINVKFPLANEKELSFNSKKYSRDLSMTY